MSGIYCIKVKNAIVYVGKAKDINERLSQHFVSIKNSSENKYQLLRKCGKPQVTFWLLEEVEIDKLSAAEQKWIEFLKPCLNSQHNGNRGKTITAQEFYNIVINTEDVVEGMKPIEYISSYGGRKK